MLNSAFYLSRYKIYNLVFCVTNIEVADFCKQWGKEALDWVLEAFADQTKPHDPHKCVSRGYMLSDLKKPYFKSDADFTNMVQPDHNLDLFTGFWGVHFCA